MGWPGHYMDWLTRFVGICFCECFFLSNGITFNAFISYEIIILIICNISPCDCASFYHLRIIQKPYVLKINKLCSSFPFTCLSVYMYCVRVMSFPV